MTSGRRGFFQAIAAAAAGGTALAKVEPVIEVPREDQLKIPGWKLDWDKANGLVTFKDGVASTWRIHWSGWKEDPCSEALIAQWTAKTGPDSGAFNNGFHGVVSVTGGGVGEYHYGDIFNLCQLDGKMIIATSTQAEKDAARKRAFDKLIEFLKTDPAADRSKCARCGGTPDKQEPKYEYKFKFVKEKPMEPTESQKELARQLNELLSRGR